MNRIVVYLFPMLMDFVLSGVLFISAYRFSEAKVAPWIVGATMAAWALIYSVLAYLSGIIVKPEKSAKFIIGSGLLIALVSVGFILFDGLYTQFLWIVLSGVSMAFFFSPFQMYMKLLEPDGNQSAGIVRPTALYTGSWSFGFAMGPLVFGCLSPLAGFIICAAGGFILAYGSWLIEQGRLKRLTHTPPSPAPVENTQRSSVQEIPYFQKYPNLVLIGWLIGGVGGLTIAVVRTMGPFRGVNILALSKSQMGTVLFLVSLLQSITAFLLIFSKEWMYKKIPAILMNGIGIAALLLFGFGSSYSAFLAAAVLYGIYSGCFYFFFVFHSLVHPQNSARYVSINECIVGATGVIAPLLGGALVTAATCGWVFICGACCILIALLIELWILRTVK